MPRGDQVARLYTLVMDLARSRRGVTAAALAARGDRKLRTVYRDLDALEQSGFPVTRLDGGKWKLIDGWDQRIPFPLTAGELLSLHIAGEMMAPLSATRAGKDFAKLHKRLTGSKPRRRSGQSELFPQPRAALHLASELEIDYEPYDGIIETLWAAIDARQTVNGYYRAVTSRDEGWREIDPYVLHYDAKIGALYLIGWCHKRADLRTFAVHRFREVAATAASFEKSTSFDLQNYLQHSFGMWSAKEAIDVKLHVRSRTAAWVKERRWHPTQKIREHKDGSIDLEMTVANTVEIVRWILSLGAEVEVLQPRALREEIVETHRRAAGDHAAPGSPTTLGEPAESLTLDDNGLGESSAHRLRRKRVANP